MRGLERSEPGREGFSESEHSGALGGIGAVAVSLICASLVWLVTALAPPAYRAEAGVSIGTGAVRPDQRLDSGVGYEVRLVRSRDLARQAIKALGIEARPEFNPSLQSPGWAGGALIAVGLARDPSRLSQEERILQAFNDHLTVRAAARTRSVKIAFQSEDRAFAAEAANRIADLYLEMLAGVTPETAPGREAGAHVLIRATEPALPQVQGSILLLLGGGAIFFAALTGFSWRGFAAVFSALARETGPESVCEQPMILGPAPVFARIHETARREIAQPRLDGATRAEVQNAQAAADIASRISSARPKPQGVRIVASSLTDAAAARPMLLAFARYLAHEDHAIVVAFDAAGSEEFRPRSGPVLADLVPAAQEPGLAELVSGRASFSDVICRDPASRLHFVTAGLGDPSDLEAFGRILAALELTYDFVLLIAPPLDQSDLGKMLAAKADFFVLATPPQPHEAAVGEAKAELIERGAREVLVIGIPPDAPAPSIWRGVCKDAA
jgi:Mrp family chromosome partitioning ATPase